MAACGAWQLERARQPGRRREAPEPLQRNREATSPLFSLSDQELLRAFEERDSEDDALQLFVEQLEAVSEAQDVMRLEKGRDLGNRW